tara:strand:+ start:318 stop:506 length:189 start_codon:yes stop_codon:yes gene_type:complete
MSQDDYIGKSGEQTSYESVVRQNENQVVLSFTIDASNNGVSAGPVTIATTATVTVNGYWSVV